MSIRPHSLHNTFLYITILKKQKPITISAARISPRKQNFRNKPHVEVSGAPPALRNF